MNLKSGLCFALSVTLLNCHSIAPSLAEENNSQPAAEKQSTPAVSPAATPSTSPSQALSDINNDPSDPNLPSQTTTTPAVQPATPAASVDKPVEKKSDELPWIKDGPTSTAQPSTEKSPEATSVVPPPKKAEPVQEKKATTQPTAKAGAAAIKLFGRIEQLSGGAGASFPVLKALTPKMDPRGLPQKQAAAEISQFSGKVVNSFPTDFSGTWGGNLQITMTQIDPLYYKVDPEEASRTAQALRPGLTGAVNFSFRNMRQANMSLQPAQILFMVPGRDTRAADQMSQMFGANSGALGALASQMAANMPVPIVMFFGEHQTHGSDAGVSGNQQRATVLKNTIRQLDPRTLEQQIVTSETIWYAKTGKPRQQYGETVVRFTDYGAGRMYVQAATVSYSAGRQFMEKVLLAGTVVKGQVVNTDPYAAMGLGGGMGGLGGMLGGAGAPNAQQIQQMQKMLQGGGGLQGLFGAPGAGGGQMPQIPGLPPGFEKMFGQ